MSPSGWERLEALKAVLFLSFLGLVTLGFGFPLHIKTILPFK